MTGKYSCLHTLTIFNLFQRTYISLVSAKSCCPQICTILDRNLCVLRSFEIPVESCGILHHVFNKDKGIVFGGFDGVLHFVALRDLQPQHHATAFEGLADDINAMTTRENLIAAGSVAGDVGLWDYAGAKLATVRPSNSLVHSLSIRDRKLLVVTRTDAYEYGIDLENYPTPVLLKPIEQLDKLGVTTWGSYSSNGENILCQKTCNVEEQQDLESYLESYRPALPLSLVDYDNVIRILSCRHALGEQAAIVIEKLHLGEKIQIRAVRVTPQEEINSLWSDRDRLYWTSSGKIRMVNFSFGLSLEAGGNGILAECFSMGLPDSD